MALICSLVSFGGEPQSISDQRLPTPATGLFGWGKGAFLLANNPPNLPHKDRVKGGGAGGAVPWLRHMEFPAGGDLGKKHSLKGEWVLTGSVDMKTSLTFKPPIVLSTP